MNNQKFVDCYTPFAQKTGVQQLAMSARKKPGHFYAGDYSARANALLRQVERNNKPLMPLKARLGNLNPQGWVDPDAALAALRRSIAKQYGLRDKPRSWYK